MAFKLDDMCFVFGSNESGLHGAGAARFAERNRGAQRGIAFGYSGNSFAIPTKDEQIRHTLSLSRIKVYVDNFKWQAHGNGPHKDQMRGKLFQVTRIGCGLAGLKDAQIAPMFLGSPKSCVFDEAWKPWLGDDYQYWGTM